MAEQATLPQAQVPQPIVPQKRVLPARERRESATKREASSPVSTTTKAASTPKKSTPAKSTPKPATTKYKRRKPLPEATPTRRFSTPIVEEGLPTKITDSRPLPTSHRPQSSKLSAKEYQTIADSAVLAASLHRSRVKWLAEGIFATYWTKPSKKKGAEGLANNPDLKTMQRLGPSTITIGPHTFDATIYTVKDNPGYRHPNQYPHHPVALQPGFQSFQPVGPHPTISQTRPVLKQPSQTPVKQVKQEKPSPSQPVNPSMSTPKVAGASPTQASATPATQPTAVQSGPDPVIRMLATRAATNPELKALMKVVASSKASQEQLKLFQSHIDELNGVIRAQQEADVPQPESQKSRPGETLAKPAQLDGPTDGTYQALHPPQPGKYGPHSSPYPLHTQHSSPLPQAQQRAGAKIGPLGPPLNAPSHSHYPPPPLKIPIPEPCIKAIVLEFTTPATSTIPALQDRFLFPEYAVLDTPLSGQGLEMVCSFFVIRKGSDLLSMQSVDGAPAGIPVGGLIRWKEHEEYYQPVTMTIKTLQHRILETIARAAKPLGEVQAKMKEVMQSKTRVKDEWLVMRLPKEKGTSIEASGGHDRGFVDSAVEIEDDGGSGDEDDELRSFYGI